MRRNPLTIAFALCAASCAEPTASPSYTPQAAPPSGLIVSLRNAPPLSAPAGAATITAEGDSVTAAAVAGLGCGDYSPKAGLDGRTLVITIVHSPSTGACAAMASTGTFRAIVRPAPRGEYRVEYRLRVAPQQQAESEWVIGRQTVRLP